MRPAIPLALATLAIAGCGGNTKTVTVGTTETVTKTTPATATVEGTNTSKTVTGAVEQSGTVVPVLTFSGNGNKSLGAIAVQATSTLKWKCPDSCQSFEVTSAQSDSPRLDISGSGTSGSKTVKPGSYSSVRVKADSSWSFTLQQSSG